MPAKTPIIAMFSVIIILGLIGGLLYRSLNKKGGSPDDYVIEKVAKGNKRVLNLKAGLKIRIPESWEAVKVDKEKGSIVILNKDLKARNLEDITFPLEKGCLIEVAVLYKNMDFDEVKKEVKKVHQGIGILSENFSMENINNTVILRDDFDSRYLGRGISFFI